MLNSPIEGSPDKVEIQEAKVPMAPRGSGCLIYVSDPSSIARRHLPSPTTEADLRRWVDELADAGIDTFIQEAFTQGWTTYWRTDRFEYDARPQHERFLPLLDWLISDFRGSHHPSARLHNV